MIDSGGRIVFCAVLPEHTVQLHRKQACLAATSARALPLASVVLVVRCAFTLITANFFGIFMANIKSFTNPACLMGDPAEVRNFLVCQMTPKS